MIAKMRRFGSALAATVANCTAQGSELLTHARWAGPTIARCCASMPSPVPEPAGSQSSSPASQGATREQCRRDGPQPLAACSSDALFTIAAAPTIARPKQRSWPIHRPICLQPAHSTISQPPVNSLQPSPNPWLIGTIQTRSRHTNRLVRPQFQNSLRGWARNSDDRDRAIRAIGNLEELKAYWETNGGVPYTVPTTPRLYPGGRNDEQEDEGTLLTVPRPCRLDSYNLATFLAKAAEIAPAGILASQDPTIQDTQGEHQWSEEEVALLRQLCGEACSWAVRRSKLCEPSTAALTLASLSRLGHSNPDVTSHFLALTLRRMSEATSRDLRLIGQALSRQGYQEGGEWWAAAWQHVTYLLPSGLVPPLQIKMLVDAGDACGHPAPEAVVQWVADSVQALNRAAENMQALPIS